MEENKDNGKAAQNSGAPAPTDPDQTLQPAAGQNSDPQPEPAAGQNSDSHNPYPYPLQQPNRRGWLKALLALIIVAVVVTIVCLVVGIYDHHEASLEKDNIQNTEIIVEP